MPRSGSGTATLRRGGDRVPRAGVGRVAVSCGGVSWPGQECPGMGKGYLGLDRGASCWGGEDRAEVYPGEGTRCSGTVASGCSASRVDRGAPGWAGVSWARQRCPGTGVLSPARTAGALAPHLVVLLGRLGGLRTAGDAGGVGVVPRLLLHLVEKTLVAGKLLLQRVLDAEQRLEIGRVRL